MVTNRNKKFIANYNRANKKYQNLVAKRRRYVNMGAFVSKWNPLRALWIRHKLKSLNREIKAVINIRNNIAIAHRRNTGRTW